MQIELSTLTDSPVWCNSTQIGLVWRVAFDLTNGQVLGILIDHETVAPAEAITELNQSGVKVRASEKVRAGSLVAQAAAASVHILHARAFAEDGTTMGTVTDASILFPMLQLSSIVVSSEDGERLITRTDIISMNHDRVIVRGELAQKVFDWNGPAANPILTTNRTV